MRAAAVLIAIMSLCTALAWAQPDPAIEFSPPEWRFGAIDQGSIAKAEVTATNRGDLPRRVSFVSTCTCLTVSPSSLLLAPGAKGSFALSFDSSDYTGVTRLGYLVSSDRPGSKPWYYVLRGVVRAENPAVPPRGAESGSWSNAAGPEPGAPPLVLAYYYTQGCRSCDEFLSVEIPKLEARLGLVIRVEKKDLLDTKNFEELSAAALALGQKVEAIPALAFGGLLIQGDARIRDELPALLAAAKLGAGQAGAASSGTGASDAAAPPGPATGAARLALLPVIAAGLVDGVNPCAFTTLIFLLASLALAGRGRREVLLIGALFSLGVFLTYLAVGLGLFAALRAASGVALVSRLLRWALAAALAVFAALSVYDYFLIRAGKASEMLLQLPSALKGRIHASIRTRARSAALAGSSLVLGFLVSIFEFACTGQVYLPTLAYLARVQRRADALGLLLVYNLSFIAPLLVVFAASYFGVSSKRIAALFQRRMGAIKLALALAFLVLAAMTVLA